MGNKKVHIFSAALCLLVALSFDACGASGRYLPIESLLGKFEGIIQVENSQPVEHSYQTEVIAVDKPANTVSLKASCLDCGTKRWARNNCEIREITDRIRFVCKGPVSDEAYTFDGNVLKATGFGNKYPYSIHVTKR
jgi:hypothetical protein